MNEKLVITFLLLVWWFGNALYAVDAQLLLKDSPHRFLSFDLAFIQVTFGLISSDLLHRIETYEDKTSISNDLNSFSFYSWKSIAAASTPLLFSGACNYIGTLMTNRSYQIIGSTSTLVWKLSEPVSVVILKRIVLQEITSLRATFGVLQVIFGVLCFVSYGNGLKVSLSTPIVLSNFVYPLRNILVKLDQKIRNTKDQKRSSLDTYRCLALISFPFAFVGCVLATIYRGSFTPTRYFILFLRNSFLFNSYQIASISLLTRLDPLTHAVSNTLKRFTAIVISIILGRELLGSKRMLSLLLTALGFLVYSSSAKIFADKADLVQNIQRMAFLSYIIVSVYLFLSTDLSWLPKQFENIYLQS